MAESNYHGVLVAPNTNKPSLLLPTPYIYTKNSVMTLLDASDWFPSLLPHIESISSMNIIEGFFSLAIVNNYFMSLSDSPTYLEMRSEELTEMNVPSHSVAHAFAKKVLPVPGGPYSRIPIQGFRAPLNRSGKRIGNITAY